MIRFLQKGPRHHHHSPALSTAGLHKRAAARLPRRPLRPSPVIGRGVAAAFLHALSALELALAGAGRGVAAEDDKAATAKAAQADADTMAKAQADAAARKRAEDEGAGRTG